MAKKKYGAVDIESPEDEQESDIVESQPKDIQVLDITNSDYINSGLEKVKELGEYNLKAIHIIKGRNTVIEIFK